MKISWWYDDGNIVKKVWQTDRQTDGQTENTICRAAWSQLKRGSSCAFPVPEDIIGVFLTFMECFTMYIFPYFTSKFYELVVNFNHYELDLITSICAYLGMTDFGTYNKSHGPARENTDHPDFHYATQDSHWEMAFSAHCTHIWKLNRISMTSSSKVGRKCIRCYSRVQRCVTARLWARRWANIVQWGMKAWSI